MKYSWCIISQGVGGGGGLWNIRGFGRLLKGGGGAESRGGSFGAPGLRQFRLNGLQILPPEIRDKVISV